MNERVALVTGGTRGIGAAISTRLAQHGARIAAVYNRDIEAAESFAKEAGNNGLSVSLHQANVGNPADCQRVVHEVLRQYGQMVAALPEDIVQAVIDVIPMHALGTPGDVAEAVRYRSRTRRATSPARSSRWPEAC